MRTVPDKKPYTSKSIDLTIKRLLRKGGIGVVPTDTIYGISAKALLKDPVLRIYKLRRRDLKKPMIVLISSLNDLKKFGIKLSKQERDLLSKNWPGKISIILPCPGRNLFYLHRGVRALAFRMPKDQKLRKLIKEVGPLVSTSVNFEGKEPAESISEAQDYFGEKLDFYIDRGKLTSPPSTLIQLKNGKASLLREGDAKFKE